MLTCWFYYGVPTAAPSVNLPLSYTNNTTWACSFIIHNPSTDSYYPSVHIYSKNKSGMELSIRNNGVGVGQTIYGISIGY